MLTTALFTTIPSDNLVPRDRYLSARTLFYLCIFHESLIAAVPLLETTIIELAAIIRMIRNPALQGISS